MRFIPFSAVVHSFTRIAPAVGGTGCAGGDTRDAQATGVAAATIEVTWIEVCMTDPTANTPPSSLRLARRPTLPTRQKTAPEHSNQRLP